MAVTALTVIEPANSVATSDQSATPGTQIVTGADGGSIAAGNRTDRMVLYITDGGAGDTVVVTAGDKPPGERAGLGALSVTMAASDTKWLVIEGSRYLQDDGTLLITCTNDANITIAPVFLPNTI